MIPSIAPARLHQAIRCKRQRNGWQHWIGQRGPARQWRWTPGDGSGIWYAGNRIRPAPGSDLDRDQLLI